MTVLLHNVTPTLAVMTAVTIVLWVAVVIHRVYLWCRVRDWEHELGSESTPPTRPDRPRAARTTEPQCMAPTATDTDTVRPVATPPDRENHGYGGEVL